MNARNISKNLLMLEDQFLAAHNWADAAKTPLAGDASSRRYTRLGKPSGTAILMDEGPGSKLQLDLFSKIAEHLSSLGLSAPKIIAGDSDQYLLIEDLGDAVFARVIERNPDLEETLYSAAIDALIASQNGPVPHFISAYGAPEMTRAIRLTFEYYPTPDTKYQVKDQTSLLNIFNRLLSKHLAGKDVLIQRDFHAENLIWLPDRTGSARVGLLDFQDAVSGHPAYDLASLLVDARREVSPETRRTMIKAYVQKTGMDLDNFSTAFALCSSQRNLRILGIFSRLAIRDNKPGYIDLIPRVWQNLMCDLQHPSLLELKQALSILPEPTEALLNKIRAAHV
jgi:aminoglycoside/choline kinase family phosphotransferase